MRLPIPEFALVALVGPSGSGKSTFARRHFRSTEIVSSDHCRALVADDEGDQSATPDAFAVLHFIVARRLARARLTVVDATHVQPDSRQPILKLARDFHCLPVAIVFDLPEAICLARNEGRAERQVPARVVRGHAAQMRRTVGDLRREGFRQVWTFTDQAQVDAAEVDRVPLRVNLRHEHGPFDLVGDVHGCFEELGELLDRLGYAVRPVEHVEAVGGPGWDVTPPPGRKLVFVGDLCDRGPNTPDVLKLVMGMAAKGDALCVQGNHDAKLARKLAGHNVKMAHGLLKSVEQLAADTDQFRQRAGEWLDRLHSHVVLDDGKLVVAHAGLKESMHGRTGGAVRNFALFGETTGETEPDGMPVRIDWAADYRGRANVVYGHTPVLRPEWVNRTLCVDTGCVFGGMLTAYRYPEGDIVSVPAKAAYWELKRPLAVPGSGLSAQQAADDLLDLADVLGKRTIWTSLMGAVTVREENSAAALEVMSRFAADPRWLVYLPPTMSPPDAAREGDCLERPESAFDFYRAAGVGRVVCEAKHMGSRAVVVACRDADTARQRFGVESGEAGVVLTRTGRHFFDNAPLAAAFIDRVRTAIAAAGWWETLNTGWVVLDCELMPWSAKAQELLRGQYAAAGSAGRAALAEAVAALEASPSAELEPLRQRFRARRDDIARFVNVYRGYCWPVNGLDDLRLAPFHLLAAEGAVFTDQPHLWHLDRAAELHRADPGFLVETPFRDVPLDDPAAVSATVAWWETLTTGGGEGMVVKPTDFVARGGRGGIVQPAVKVRGREYLRLIYGPDYTLPDNLGRLRRRNVSGKRGLALREFALGVEGLERFVRREPLRRVHECVFAVLALESEPVDPRL